MDEIAKNWTIMSLLGREIDILANYPKTKRDLTARREFKSKESKKIAREFGKDYFDGDRRYGYGGFEYNPKFWQPVIPTLVENYQLDNSSSVLDVGCAKGFLLYDLKLTFPEIHVSGIDISEYAISNSKSKVKLDLQVGSATALPFGDNLFDFVISINTIHNLEIQDCAKALKEITRVSKGKSFITVDAYRNSEEKDRMEAWNLTALTMMSVDEWKNFFVEVGYKGDFYWFIP
jgi:SAM-dependent methyltransferase